MLVASAKRSEPFASASLKTPMTDSGPQLLTSMHICFLDIDGTLVLTGGAGHIAFARTLADDFGISEIDQTISFAGRSDRAIAMDLFQSHGIEPSRENWQRFYEKYLGRLDQALAANKGYVLPGVVQLLETLT